MNQTPQSHWGKCWQMLIAYLMANLFTTFHWSCWVHHEIEWVTHPGNEWTKHTTFIGVVNTRHELVRSYYGKSFLYQESTQCP